MLYTAEWQVWSCPRWMIDEDHARIDLGRNPGGAFLIFAEDYVPNERSVDIKRTKYL
jgi:hypothetical protein